MKCRVGINLLDHGLYTSVLEHVMKLILCICVLLAFKIEHVNITMLEQFCTMYEKCKFLSMGYILALTKASMLI